MSIAKTIVITGATKGIGRAIAIKFGAAGFNLALCARTAKDLKALKATIAATGTKAEILIQTCDVSKKNDAEAFGDKVLKQFGAVDIIINNAGVFLPGQVYKEKPGTLEKLMATNLYSAYHLTRRLLPPMIKKKRGHIFSMCSVASIGAYPNGGSYSISKFALLGFSKALREELKPFNIKVTALIAGATFTDSWAGAGLPAERFMKPEDVADVVWGAYSLSDGAVMEEVLLRPVLGDI